MRRSLLTFVLACLCIAMPHAKDADLSGVYTCTGVNPEGEPYHGVVAIEKRGEVYHLQWSFARSALIYGIGFLDHGRLSVAAFSVAGEGDHQVPIASNMAVYEVKGSTLKGRWTAIHPQAEKLYVETLEKMDVRQHPPPTSAPAPSKPSKHEPRKKGELDS